jgi:hypothetical protein
MVYRWYAVTVRLLFLGLCALTSVYALLAFIPFTYHQVIASPLLGWQTGFVRSFPLIAIAMTLLLGTALRDELRSRLTRIPAILFLLFQTGASIALVRWNILATLEQSSRSLLWAFLALVPPVLLGVVDLVGGFEFLRRTQADEENDTRPFQAAFASAIFVTLFYSIMSGALADPSRKMEIILSLVFHLLIFGLGFILLSTLRSLAEIVGLSIASELVLVATLATAVISYLLVAVVYPAISFSGDLARIFALTFAVATFFSWLGISLRSATDETVRSGLHLFLAPIPLSRARNTIERWLAFAVLVAIVYPIAARAAVVDWDFLLQKLAATLIAILAFATFHGICRPWHEERQGLLLTGALTVLALFVGVARGPAVGVAAPPALSAVSEQTANANPSFRLLYRALTPPPPEDQMDFFKYLQRTTNIGRDIDVKPVDIRLTRDEHAVEAPKPHIFVFVVDSLRRDYLSPYNPKVTFTPSTAELAKDSFVFERAFTPYGGTGLSEPSVWTGSLLLHKQYVTPFAPMNTLQKLLEENGYRMFVAVDSVLDVVVEETESVTRLDTGGITHDFCRSTTDLQARIAQEKGDRPLFAYVQPQNIHIAAINRDGTAVPEKRSYDGFHPPYASRLERVDQCLGEFLGFLRERGLYDDSVIVLTSDHGDSLGEGGRWGHAYTIYPEVMKIPMIVKLPAAVKAEFEAKPSEPAYLIDLSPTLHYLMGHRSFVANPLFGRPLIRHKNDGRTLRAPRPQLVVSSYGPVYGEISADGRSLYIADALNFTDHAYDLDRGAAGKERQLSASERKESRQWIRASVEELNRFYAFNPGP